MNNNETRESFDKWFSNEGEWPKAIERSERGEYLLSAACVGWKTWDESAKSERNRIAKWIDSDWPADSAEERYHRAWIAAKLRLNQVAE